MSAPNDEFTRFEHEGWQRVADKYDSVWAQSTRQFIPSLLDAAEVSARMAVLDIGSGPGYVAGAVKQRGAVPTGLDFSNQMVSIAQTMFPGIEFREGDAQTLPFADESFDRVVANFALLHLSDPGRACAEACRVLKPRGRFGFTVWAEAAGLFGEPRVAFLATTARERLRGLVDLVDAVGRPWHSRPGPLATSAQPGDGWYREYEA